MNLEGPKTIEAGAPVLAESTGFSPAATYDRNLDRIIVWTPQCQGATEERVNERFTLLVIANPKKKDPAETVGFMINGVRVLSGHLGSASENRVGLFGLLESMGIRYPEIQAQLRRAQHLARTMTGTLVALG